MREAPVRLFLCSLFCLPTVILRQGLPAGDDANLAANPGFENIDDNGRLRPWSVRSPVYSLCTESPRSGKRCLRFENDNPDRYVLCSAPLKLEPGKQYEITAWVRTEDIAGEDSGATICVQWWDKDRKFIGGAYPKGIKGTHAEWQLVRGITKKVPENAVTFDVTCYVRKHMTGVAWWDDITVRRYFPPLVDGITTNAFRNETAGGRIGIKAGLNLAGNGLSLDQVIAELCVNDSGGKTVVKVSPQGMTEEEVAFRLNAASLPPGAYELVCRAYSKDERIQGEVSCQLKRREGSRERKAYIDEHQRLILDGKPFFPLGTYWGGVTEKHLDIYAKSPFNCLMPYGSPSRKMLDAVHARGLKVIYSIKDYYYGTKYCPKHIKSEADERPAIETKVKQVGDHPAIMAWYINDELPLSMVDRLAAHRRWMEELDPNRPTWVVLYQVGQVRSYLPTFDVIGTDPYPIPHRPPSTALRYTRKTREAGFGYRAIWMVPQIFNWASYRKAPEGKEPYRSPTLQEMRSMAWQCIAGGANGLVFYSWFDLWRMSKDVKSGGRALKPEPFEERWKDVTEMATEIKQMMPVLLSVDPTPPPKHVECPDSIAWRLYAKDGDVYLVAVNSDRSPAEASFVFATTFTGAKTVLGQIPAACSGSQVSLAFAPLEPKIVRLSRAARSR